MTFGTPVISLYMRIRACLQFIPISVILRLRQIGGPNSVSVARLIPIYLKMSTVHDKLNFNSDSNQLQSILILPGKKPS